MAALLVLPGALVVYLSFRGGGFFAGTPALLAVVIAAVLVIRTTVARDPFGGVGTPGAVACVALGLFAVWVLSSAWWSGAPSRALLEFDRALLYLLVLLLFASLPWKRGNLQWLLRGVAAGIVVVAGIALITRVLPGVWPISGNVHPERLSYPLTYWNALGVLAAVGFVLCTHLSSSLAEPRAVRAVAAAALPVLATTLYFTFSRGGIAAGLIGLVVYFAVARPRGALATLLVGVPAVGISVAVAYNADLLARTDYTGHGGVAQGHHVALAVGLCALGAGLARLLLAPLDVRIERGHVPRRVRRPLGVTLVAVPLVAILAVVAATGAPHSLSRQYHRFLHGDYVHTTDLRSRLGDAGNNGRLDHWRVALDSFDKHPFAGAGAGTYQVLWAQHRHSGFTVVDGHSLYIEVLGELGIVGLLLVLTAIGALLVAVARRARGNERALYAAVLAAMVTWAVHAGVDWDWEMPAVTLWVFALAGAAIALPPISRRRRRRAKVKLGRAPRLWIAAGFAALAVAPALVALSQQRLNASAREFARGDCHAAIDSALGSISAMSVRAEPYELLSYCDARLGLSRLSIAAMQNAIKRDPDNWEFHYGLGIVRAAAGLDPRPALRDARRLNPLNRLIRDEQKVFDTPHPDEWKPRALVAPLTVSTPKR
jgi:O-antigen ligase